MLELRPTIRRCLAATPARGSKQGFRYLVLALLLSVAGIGHAGPWVSPGDSGLRSDLTTLADAGILTSPITTWPTPWGDIMADLREADSGALSPSARIALERVRLAARMETRTGVLQGMARISGAEKQLRIRSFEDTAREDAELSSSIAWTGERLAFALEGTYVSLPDNETETRPDGSYLGVALGNWMVVLGYPERWWGPGWDGSLILSTNARPTPQVAVSRNSATPFRSRWLRWIGPWTLTAFMGELDDARAISNARLFGARVAFKPLQSLEIGLSRTAQWCGDARPCDADTFVDLLFGRDNRGVNVAAEDEPGNQLAGFDVRWAMPWWNRSAAVYAQWIGEDTRQGGPQPGDWLRLLGVEYSGAAFGGRWRHRSYFELADTECQQGGLGFSGASPNCAYRHSIYRSGYRYEGGSIGHGIDGDGNGFSIGSIVQRGDDTRWQLLLRNFEINAVGSADPNHTISPTPQEIVELSMLYARPLWIGELRAGLGYRDVTDTVDAARDDGSAFGWLEFVIR